MFQSIIQSLIARATVAIINFLILVISSRYLGAASRGEISLFVLNITVIQIINEIYTGYSAVHFINKYDFRRTYFTGLLFTFFFCTVSNIALVFLKKQVPGFGWAGYVISFMVIVNTFNCIMLLGRQKLRAFNLLCFLQPFLLLTGMAFSIIILKVYTFSAYLLPLAFSFSAALIFSSYFVFKLFPGSGKGEFRALPVFVRGLQLQLATFMFILGNRYSYYLLADHASVGIYSAAAALVEAVLVLTYAIAPVLLARIAGKGDVPESAAVSLGLAKFSLFFSAIFVALLGLLPEAFFTFLLGKGFSGVKELMLLYAPSVLIISFFNPLSNYFTAIGKPRSVLFSYTLGFMFTIFVTPLLISRYGVKGAAFGAFLTYLSNAIMVSVLFIGHNRTTLVQFFEISSAFITLRAFFGTRRKG
jgi:O-antigen/teichoic acid export membrane protein